MACGPGGLEAPATEEPAPVDDVVVVGCDDVVGGIPLGDGLVEAGDDFDADLAALDLEGLPAVISTAGIDGFFLATLAWTLDIEVFELDDGIDRDAFLNGTPMERAVLGAFATDAALADGGVDFRFLRRALHRFHACQQRLPATLADFKKAYGNWGEEGGLVITNSQPKAGPRRLIELPGEGRTAFVAETVVDGVVRETEIVLLGTRRDGALDFVVYDAAGDISAGSTFATRGGGTVNTAAPYTCLVCHLSDDDVPAFNVVRPE